MVGGNSNLTADMTINSASANTSGSGNVPNGTPVAFAGVLGTVSPANTSTTSGKANSTYTGTAPGSGSASSTVDGQTVSTPITVNPAPSPPIVKIADPAGCLGPAVWSGSRSRSPTPAVRLNSSASPRHCQHSCSRCKTLARPTRAALPIARAARPSPGAERSRPAKPRRLTYQAQVASGTLPNTQLCINTSATFGQAAPVTVQACTTVNCPVVGPGALPPADAAVSDQKAGSVLFYNIYTSNPADLTHQNTRINITNTDPARSAVVHLFFVDGSNCSPADFLYLPDAESDPKLHGSGCKIPARPVTSWAVASDPITGCPINFNFLIGDEFVKFSSGHQANLGAESFAALSNTLPPACIAGSGTADTQLRRRELQSGAARAGGG